MPRPPHSWHSPTRSGKLCSRDNLCVNIHSRFAYNSKIRKEPNLFAIAEWLKHIVGHPYCGTLPNNQKEELLMCAKLGWISGTLSSKSQMGTYSACIYITFSNDNKSWEMDGCGEELKKR